MPTLTAEPLTETGTEVCTDHTCLQARSPIALCTCRCRGAGHGRDQSRAGLMPARPVSAQAVRSARATRMMLAELMDETAF
jgi:hypothetical protein